MAVGEPAAELLQRLAHSTGRSRCSPEGQDCRVRRSRRLRLGFGQEDRGGYERVWFEEWLGRTRSLSSPWRIPIEEGHGGSTQGGTACNSLRQLLRPSRGR